MEKLTIGRWRESFDQDPESAMRRVFTHIWYWGPNLIRRSGLTTDDLVEDVLQDVAYRLLTDPGPLLRAREESPLDAFLRGFVRNFALKERDRALRRRRLRSLAGDSEGAVPRPTIDPIDLAMARDELTNVRAALPLLPRPHREIIQLLADGWPPEEVGEWTVRWLGVTRSRAKEMRKEARRSLAIILAGGNPPRPRRILPPPPRRSGDYELKARTPGSWAGPGAGNGFGRAAAVGRTRGTERLQGIKREEDSMLRKACLGLLTFTALFAVSFGIRDIATAASADCNGIIKWNGLLGASAHFLWRLDAEQNVLFCTNVVCDDDAQACRPEVTYPDPQGLNHHTCFCPGIESTETCSITVASEGPYSPIVSASCISNTCNLPSTCDLEELSEPDPNGYRDITCSCQ